VLILLKSPLLVKKNVPKLALSSAEC